MISCKKDDSYPYSNRTIHVHYGKASIQGAIDIASDFDTILVSNGEYNENLNFNGKKIYLTSYYYRTLNSSDIVNTIIKGKSNSVVRFQNHEDSTAVLDGFTLTGGSPGGGPMSNCACLQGGGIYIKAASPTLKNLIIEDNRMFWPNTNGDGGGIYCDSGSIKATNLKIRNNLCGGRGGGGGIYASNSEVILDNCEINNNHSVPPYCEGLYFSNINFIIENSRIENNMLDNPDNLCCRIAIGIYNSNGSFANTIINDIIDQRNSNIKYSSSIINNVVYP
jgi:hypothetical protein